MNAAFICWIVLIFRGLAKNDGSVPHCYAIDSRFALHFVFLCNDNSGMIENSELSRYTLCQNDFIDQMQILCVLKLSATYFYSDAVFLYILICAMNNKMINTRRFYNYKIWPIHDGFISIPLKIVEMKWEFTEHTISRITFIAIKK